MSLTILTTPKSITIKDADNNSLVVVKTEIGIELHSRVETNKKNKPMLNLQATIKNIVLNPKDNRDNYKVRFAQLAKALTEVNTDSFTVLQNKLKLV